MFFLKEISNSIFRKVRFIIFFFYFHFAFVIENPS